MKIALFLALLLGLLGLGAVLLEEEISAARQNPSEFKQITFDRIDRALTGSGGALASRFDSSFGQCRYAEESLRAKPFPFTVPVSLPMSGAPLKATIYCLAGSPATIGISGIVPSEIRASRAPGEPMSVELLKGNIGLFSDDLLVRIKLPHAYLRLSGKRVALFFGIEEGAYSLTVRRGDATLEAIPRQLGTGTPAGTKVLVTPGSSVTINGKKTAGPGAVTLLPSGIY